MNHLLGIRIATTTIAVVLGSVVAIAQAEPQQNVEPSADAAPTLLRTRCLECHDTELIFQQRLSIDGWSREIVKRTGWGARISELERPVLARYLAASDSGRTAPEMSAPATDEGAAILRSRCLSCHDGALIEQQRLGAEAWSRELDKMIAWGSALSAREKTVLVEYLSARKRP